MAMEYVYVGETSTNIINLPKFGDLCYSYDGRSGTLKITDGNGEQKALFYVKPDTCYMLQRRNKSALQLHEVTPPHFCVDTALWLFGFVRKHRCDNQNSFEQACDDFQKAHPDFQVTKMEIDYAGSCLKYAFVSGTNRTSDYLPVAYCYRLVRDTAWAFHGKETLYEVIARMHGSLGNFRYPLQYVIHIFKSTTISYPTETRDFFQKRLGYWNDDVYYADCSESGF